MQTTNLLRCLILGLRFYSLAHADQQQHPLTADASAPAAAAAAVGLDFTSPAPHVFSSLRYLLEQWPNTYIPNGHSIVPCEVAAYTPLYHGRRDGLLPSSPEWFAFDAEMSYGIMGSNRDSHLLTYQNVKPVQCLYFDGMSAALMGSGPLDSQMVFLCGNTTCQVGGQDQPWRGIFDEYARAEKLCRWVQSNGLGGVGWGVEGIVRMNAGFEMIWCNFTSPSLRLLSHVNVSVPLLPEGFWDAEATGQMGSEDVEELATRSSPISTATSSSTSEIPTGKPDMPPPPNWRDKAELEPFLQSQSFEWYRSATWHKGSSGSGAGRPESRVKLNTCGFLSYYDSIFKDFSIASAKQEQSRLNLTADGVWKGAGHDGNTTLALQQLSRRRRSHTLDLITNFEGSIMSQSVLQTLHDINSTSSHCTGIDWAQKTIDITSRYSQSLTQLLHLLEHPPSNISTNTTISRNYLAALRSKTHAMSMPYLTYPLTSSCFDSTLNRCINTHLPPVETTHPLLASEQTILTSLTTVLSTLCNTTLSLTYTLESLWQQTYQTNSSSTNSSTNTSISIPTASLATPLSQLRAWLGWFPDTMHCDVVCAVDEFCFVPIWPLTFLEPRGGFGRGRPRRPPPPDDGKPSPQPPGRGGGGAPGEKRPPPPPRRNPWQDWDEQLWTPRCVKVLD